jgi:integrase
LELRKRGLAEYTIDAYGRRLRMLAKNTDIDNPQIVRDFIMRQTTSPANKEAIANAYDHYVKHFGMTWDKPFFSRGERLPVIPNSEQINTIIQAFTRKYVTIYSILRDTGLRPVELHRLRLKDIDLENGTINPRTAKGGAGRVLKLPPNTHAMLKEYIEKNGFSQTSVMFPPTKRLCHVWVHTRNQIAKKLSRPELSKYRVYDLRHYYATMLYSKTKDILLVMTQLGHKSLEHTRIYTHLLPFKEEEYVSKAVALGTSTTLKECIELAESGFTKFTEIDGYQIFRKTKSDW